jgi:hypothetical protein
LKTDGTDELHVYGAFGELVGTYPIFVIPNPNGTPSGSYGIGAGPTNLYLITVAGVHLLARKCPNGVPVDVTAVCRWTSGPLVLFKVPPYWT